jgi:hypothetical protein
MSAGAVTNKMGAAEQQFRRNTEIFDSGSVPEIITQQISVITNAPLPGKGVDTPFFAGLNIRWGLKNIPFPITRSCLAGASL